LIADTVHVLLAGAWPGGVLFTTFVVSRALKAMNWDEAERVGVRAVIGRRYTLVGGVNLALLAVSAPYGRHLRRFRGSPVRGVRAAPFALRARGRARGVFWSPYRGYGGCRTQIDGCRRDRVVRAEEAEPAAVKPEGVVGQPGGQRDGRRARR
jgi:hypothetical protein